MERARLPLLGLLVLIGATAALQPRPAPSMTPADCKVGEALEWSHDEWSCVAPPPDCRLRIPDQCIPFIEARTGYVIATMDIGDLFAHVRCYAGEGRESLVVDTFVPQSCVGHAHDMRL